MHQKFRYIKTLRHILLWVVWTVIGVYTLGVALLNTEAVQHYVANEVSETLTEYLSAEIKVGRVNVGLFNRLIIDDVAIEDQRGETMLRCGRASAKLSLLPLLKGRIVVSSAQLFGADVNLYKESSHAPLNCQFVIDRLSSRDTTRKSRLDLQILSLVVRNSSMRFDRKDTQLQRGVIDGNHLALDKISAHVMLYKLTNDSISMRMKKLSFEEKNSGFGLQKLAFEMEAGKSSLSIRDAEIKSDYSDVSLDVLLRYNEGKIRNVSITSNHSLLSTRDVKFFMPHSRFDMNRSLFVDVAIDGDMSALRLQKCHVNTSDRDFVVRLTGELRSSGNIYDAIKVRRGIDWEIDVDEVRAEASVITDIFAGFEVSNVSALEYVTCSAHVSGQDDRFSATGEAESKSGTIKYDFTFADKQVAGKFAVNDIQISRLYPNNFLEKADANFEFDALLSSGYDSIEKLHVDMVFPELLICGYPYREVTSNISVESDLGEISIGVNDVNALLSATISAGNIHSVINGNISDADNINIVADVKRFNPEALNLVAKNDGALYSLYAQAEIGSLKNVSKTVDLLNDARLQINGLSVKDKNGDYRCENIVFTAECNDIGNRKISLDSDFATLDASGNFDINTLAQSVENLVSSQMPTFPGLSYRKCSENNLKMMAQITDMEIFNRLLGLNISTNDTIDINVNINDELKQNNVTVSAETLKIGDSMIEDTYFNLFSPGDSLCYVMNTKHRNSNKKITEINVSGTARNNRLETVVRWDNPNEEKLFRGGMNISSQFYENNDGIDVAQISVEPSEIIIGDTVWHVHPSNIVYADKYLKVDDFMLQHDAQYIHINGTATRESSDSLSIMLQNIDVAYILNLVNFRSVDFDGLASGDIVVKSPFADLEASAQLDVNDFRFEKGRMGTLTVFADWDNEKGQVDLHAQCSDDNVIPIGYFLTEQHKSNIAYGTMKHDGRTLIDGYISAKKNYIDLDIRANNTRGEFVESFCGTFLDNANVWANGRARLWGDLSKVNLTGSVVVNGTVNVTPLNAVYTLKNDTINFLPTEIQFANCRIYDRNGNSGIVDGAIHHRHLGRMTFDIGVKADKMLCYDFPELNGATFCGHVVASGSCKITGRRGETIFDIEASPEEGTEIIYNVSSPDALQNQEFITWRDKGSLPVTDTTILSHENNKTDNIISEFRSDMRLNFLIHANPHCTLRLIMDEKTGDYIALNGNGTLRANYYNKGALQIFGNYNVTDGEYKMTIQKLITKSFKFTPGSVIAFGGDPFESAINLKAQYVVPSVPLSDLNIGNSFADNNVKVNCLMNITGTAGQPKVEFDLNLPQASADVQQMITSIMDSEQKRNQQVVYLLSVGRFYSADNNALTETGQSQASLAMQSFLSGTVSQQINNVISNLILKNRNWNFGANVSPGDEGMMNAEYEGLISGRMFNNRLQINGQFGYRDNPNATTTFIGDFDVRYLLLPSGNLQVRVYNQTSDRYFSKSSLNTQGIGIVFKHDFNSFFNNRKWVTKKSQVKWNNTERNEKENKE